MSISPIRYQDVLPPKILSNIPGTWAYDTMSRRVPQDILPRIMADNEDELLLPSSPERSEILYVLNDLKSSLESGKTGYLRGIADSGPDVEEWDRILSEIDENNKNWLDAPWAVTEFYFYRRIMEAFKFFETGYDPFIKQKFNGLIDALSYIEDVSSRLPSLIEQNNDAAIEVAILTSLWGNKMDLSLWPAKKGEGSTATKSSTYGENLLSGQSYILDNQLDDVVKYIRNSVATQGPIEISIIVDNAGYELVSDLMLGYVLLSLGIASSVVYHTKAHPTFVSDATNDDLIGTISYLKQPSEGHSHGPATTALAESLEKFLLEGKIIVSNDLFWCQPTAFWDMPRDVKEKLANSALTFVKGDANYRRLLGDRHWPLDKKSSEVLSYWHPAVVCALRTCKAELGCGIPISEQERAFKEDNNWLVSGKWGVIQLGGSSE